MIRRPVLGVTGPDKGGLAAWWFTARAVRRAGAKPVRIQPKKPRSIDDFDGLIIGGGADVSPILYGQQHLPRLEAFKDRNASGWRRLAGVVRFPLMFLIRRLLTTKTGRLDAARDRMEKALIAEAMARSLPLLGICRGMQLLNVAGGGSLHQHIEGFYSEYPAIRSVLPRKQVEIIAGSRLRRITDQDTIWVNALHSQAIDALGDGFQVCARESNGIIQAIERQGETFAIGVQWHPEYLPQQRRQRALFAALVHAAREHA